MSVVCGMTAHACAADSKFSKRHVTFESNSNRDVRFEFESNLEASQVPNLYSSKRDWIVKAGARTIRPFNRMNDGEKRSSRSQKLVATSARQTRLKRLVIEQSSKDQWQ